MTGPNGNFYSNDNKPTENTTVYAIAFDLKFDALKLYFSPVSPNNAYSAIEKILNIHGFSRQQGSVYFGDSKVNSVTTVLAIIDVQKKLPWLSQCVADIRMLRIEDQNDLMPAVLSAAPSVPLVAISTPSRGEDAA